MGTDSELMKQSFLILGSNLTILVYVLLFGWSVSAWAESNRSAQFEDWAVYATNDDMTNIKTVGTRAAQRLEFGGVHQFGIECGRRQTFESVYFTWAIDGGSFFGSTVNMIVKVDDNPPQNLLAGTYDDSYDSGYASFIGYGAGRELLPQLKAGSRARIRIQSGTTTINFSVSLKGATKGIAEVMAACDQ